VFSGPDSLDGLESNAAAGNSSMPLGTFCASGAAAATVTTSTTSTSIIADSSSSSCLVISGVIDGPLPGGHPKAVELYARCDIANMSAYGFASATNGAAGGVVEAVLPGVGVSQGDFVYLTQDADEFVSFFGFRPAVLFVPDGYAVSINGDDALELFLDGVVVDTYGVVGEHGDSTVWEYTDGACVHV
jgi:hypothetical protein